MCIGQLNNLATEYKGFHLYVTDSKPAQFSSDKKFPMVAHDEINDPSEPKVHLNFLQSNWYHLTDSAATLRNEWQRHYYHHTPQDGPFTAGLRQWQKNRCLYCCHPCWECHTDKGFWSPERLQFHWDIICKEVELIPSDFSTNEPNNSNFTLVLILQLH